MIININDKLTQTYVINQINKYFEAHNIKNIARQVIGSDESEQQIYVSVKTKKGIEGYVFNKPPEQNKTIIKHDIGKKNIDTLVSEDSTNEGPFKMEYNEFKNRQFMKQLYASFKNKMPRSLSIRP